MKRNDAVAFRNNKAFHSRSLWPFVPLIPRKRIAAFFWNKIEKK